MGIKIKSKDGEELDMVYLVRQSSKFAAKIVPPYEILKRFFFLGKSRYTYHSDVEWESFILSWEDYFSIVRDLVDIYGFSEYPNDSSDIDDLEWYVMSIAKSYGLSVHVVRDLAEKMYWAQCMIECVDSISKNAMDDDFLKISEDLRVKMRGVFNDLERLS